MGEMFGQKKTAEVSDDSALRDALAELASTRRRQSGEQESKVQQKQKMLNQQRMEMVAEAIKNPEVLLGGAMKFKK